MGRIRCGRGQLAAPILLIALIPASLSSLAAGAEPKSVQAFVLPERDLVPEGIAYDPATRSFFVGSTFKRKIVRIDAQGRVSDFVPQGRDGLWGVVGMKVDPARRVLWAASSHSGSGMPMIDMDPREEGSSGVFKYDLGTGKLVEKYVIGGPSERHFFNDLVVTSKGQVFVTDSREQAVYRISPGRGRLELFVKPQGMASPNGIALSDDERHLFLALRGAVGKVEIATGAFSLLTRPPGLEVKADGLYFYKGSLVTVWRGGEGVISRYHLDAGRTSIERRTVVEMDHPQVEQPTTGVIVGDAIYYVANSQLQAFKAIFKPDGTYPLDRLREPVILKVPLE